LYNWLKKILIKDNTKLEEDVDGIYYNQEGKKGSISIVLNDIIKFQGINLISGYLKKFNTFLENSILFPVLFSKI